MRRGIDTAGKARCDDEALEAEIGGKTSREFLSDRRAVARADDGDDGNRGEVEIALHVKKRRGSVDFAQAPAGSPARRWRRAARREPPPRQAPPRLVLAYRVGCRACAPPRRDSIGTASMAASAPPNSLTSARKVAGPTFSLRIRRSQASRWRRLSLTVASLRGALGAALANPRLLATRQPPRYSRRGGCRAAR